MTVAFQSGILVPVSCAVRHHVRNPLLFCSEIHPEQGESNRKTKVCRWLMGVIGGKCSEVTVSQ